MSSTLRGNLYWDACVFIAYLNNQRDAYGDTVDHIEQYLREARSGKWRIYTSTITIAEIPRSRLTRTANFGSFTEFLTGYQAAVIQITPDPIIMTTAADLHGLTYIKSNGVRKLDTPDAIHFATALALQQTYGVALDAFHTFDNGGKRGPYGRSVPLLTYETWCEKCQNVPLVQEAIRLNRQRPLHASPELTLLLRTTPSNTAAS